MTIDSRIPAKVSTGSRSLRATAAAALISGTALVADTVTIAIINRAFDPLDSAFFLLGFVGMLLTIGCWAVHMTRRLHGASRAGAAVGMFVAAGLALGVVSLVFDQIGRHVFSPANKGLHGEWSFFSIGVVLLSLGAWAIRRRQQQKTGEVDSR